jgi:hypothetical protein
MPGFLYGHLPAKVGHFWCQCWWDGIRTACEALFDKPFSEGMLRAGWMTRDRISGIDWNGKDDLIALRPWIVEEGELYSRCEDLAAIAQAEGMPPKIFCKMLEWLPACIAGRQTDRIRKGDI